MNKPIPLPDQRTSDVASQATVIEQTRAQTQVQVAALLADQRPRDVAACRTYLQQSFSVMAMAEAAFYRFPRGTDDNGNTNYVTGPTVELAREAARCWGNMDFGTADLRLDLEGGETELMVYAWDLQTNTRQQTTIIIPARRYTGDQAIESYRDVSENNKSVAGRAIRGVILSVLPRWFVQEAEQLARQRIARGDLPEDATDEQRAAHAAERAEAAVSMFGHYGIDQARLETKLGRPADRWDDFDLVQLKVILQSLQRREVTPDDEFPPLATTVADINAR